MYVGSRLKRAWKSGRRHLKSLPSSRTGENPPYGMIGGVEETSASFEARSAPRSYPTRSVVCVTYFEGVGDALIRQGGADPTNRCMAEHYLNLDDLRHPRIFQEYLRRNPNRGDDFASDVIRDSLAEICRQ